MKKYHNLSILEIARNYFQKGWKPLPVPFKSKNPNFEGWQKGNITESDLLKHFNGEQKNIGILLGEMSNGLTDIDLDAPEAVKLADLFLPKTEAVFGRDSKPRSHRLYITNGAKTEKFNDPLLVRKSKDEEDKACLVEIRYTGGQTLFPASVHPSGEFILWQSEGEPLEIQIKDLRRAVAKLAGASLLARYWKDGNRHELALALSGGLLRGGFSEDETLFFVRAVCIGANDYEIQDRLKAVETTAGKVRKDEKVTGFTTLAKLTDEKIIKSLCKWLEINNSLSEAKNKSDSYGEDDNGKRTQSTRLMKLSEDIELFHNSENESFASVAVNSHKETFFLKSREFRDWLTFQYWNTEKAMPSSQSVQDVVYGLSGKARFEGEMKDVHLRVAEHEDALYLDLGNDIWEVVKITKDGWEVLKTSPVKFRRTKGTLSLPVPERNGNIKDLQNFANVADEDWALLLAWLVASFRPDKPFPVLVLHGEQGSGKSTTARVLRLLIDPNKSPLRSSPKDERDLMIAANNSWVISLDNLSSMSVSLSDSLCRLSTGGGFSTRELFSDGEEILLNVTRPVVLNGIDEVISRSDLLDRSILLHLPRLTKRFDETTFWNDFEAIRPKLLGALLDAVCAALSNIKKVTKDARDNEMDLPRLADFTLWAMSAENGLGLTEGDFLQRYRGNREAVHDLALDYDSFAEVILKFMDDREIWKGLPSELLSEVVKIADENVSKAKEFPKNPKAIGRRLSLLAPNLRTRGIDYVSPDRSKRDRDLTLISVRKNVFEDGEETPF